MSLQRQHFLLSYLNTLSVGPVEILTRDLRTAVRALPTELTGRRFMHFPLILLVLCRRIRKIFPPMFQNQFGCHENCIFLHVSIKYCSF